MEGLGVHWGPLGLIGVSHSWLGALGMPQDAGGGWDIVLFLFRLLDIFSHGCRLRPRAGTGGAVGWEAIRRNHAVLCGGSSVEQSTAGE